MVLAGLIRQRKRQKLASAPADLSSGDTTTSSDATTGSTTAQLGPGSVVPPDSTQQVKEPVYEQKVGEEAEPVEESEIILTPVSQCPWLHTMTGDATVTADGTINGAVEFSTVIVRDCQLSEGKWVYEVELLTDGLMQVRFDAYSQVLPPYPVALS